MRIVGIAIAVLAAALACGPLAAGSSRAQPAVLALTPADTVACAAGGVLTGLAWLAPDTLAMLVVEPAPGREAERRGATLVVQDGAGGIARQADVGGLLDRGLAFDGASLWSCGDDRQGNSFLYGLDPRTLQVSVVYDLPGHRPCGVCFDGQDLWVADRDRGCLDRVDRSTGKVTRTVYGPGFSPCGLAWDGRDMWLTDGGTGRLYRLAGPRLEPVAVVGPEAFHQRGVDVPLGHDGRFLWFVPAGGGVAIRAEIQ